MVSPEVPSDRARKKRKETSRAVFKRNQKKIRKKSVRQVEKEKVKKKK
jgi:hypothetical protein